MYQPQLQRTIPPSTRAIHPLKLLDSHFKGHLNLSNSFLGRNAASSILGVSSIFLTLSEVCSIFWVTWIYSSASADQLVLFRPRRHWLPIVYCYLLVLASLQLRILLRMAFVANFLLFYLGLLFSLDCNRFHSCSSSFDGEPPCRSRVFLCVTFSKGDDECLLYLISLIDIF